MYSCSNYKPSLPLKLQTWQQEPDHRRAGDLETDSILDSALSTSCRKRIMASWRPGPWQSGQLWMGTQEREMARWRPVFWHSGHNRVGFEGRLASWRPELWQVVGQNMQQNKNNTASNGSSNRKRRLNMCITAGDRSFNPKHIYKVAWLVVTLWFSLGFSV